jgi:transposase
MQQFPTLAKVGLDVHATQTHAAVLDPATGQLWTRRLQGPPAVSLKFLVSLGAGASAVYEAGPTGFALARAAAQSGIDVRVVSPGQLPRKPSDRVKTDRRDAIRLARLLAAGELSFCRVPSVEEERFRDLVRAREDVRGDLMRARHRLSKFLVRQELVYAGPGNPWTTMHRRWLGRLRFADPASTATFVDYLAAVEALTERRSALERALEQLAPASPFADTVARLRCFRGIDTLSAAGVSAEVGDFARFPHPRFLTGYLGIVPSEHTSDDRRRQGGITKAGPGHARRLLVEAAHHYRHQPHVAERLARRQREQDPRVCQIAWKAQRRLHARWRTLHLLRGKPAGIVAVAVARELATFLWEAATLA